MNNDCGPGMQSYSTRSLPAGRRLSLWNQMVSEAMGTVDVQSPYRSGFNGEFSSRTVGPCVFRSVWSTAASVRCLPDPDATASRTQGITIQLLARGSCETQHNGQTLHLRSGHFVMLDTSKPYSVRFEEPVLAHSVRLPRAHLVKLGIDPERHIGVPIPAGHGAGSLFSAFLTSVCEGANDPFEERWAGPVRDILLTLLELVYKPSGGPTPRTAGQTYERARQIVDSQLRDFEFNARELASMLGVSERYLQQVFSREGITPTRYILKRRLDLAASRLSRSDAGTRISEIAFSAGFSDLSYFCHAFRRQFGLAPGEFRRRQDS